MKPSKKCTYSILINTLMTGALLFAAACHQKKKPLPESVRNFDRFPGTEFTLFISCNKCDCILREMDAYFTKHPFNSTRFTVYADTNCLGRLAKKIPVTHLPQQEIDSCSKEFYNLLVRTKKEGGFRYKIVTTKESSKLPVFLND
jgi:hypothetical protein